MVRSQALFGVALFMLGASLASSSFAGAITALTMIPAMLIFEAISITDIVVSIVAIFAAKKYGPKTLIASSVGKYYSQIRTCNRIFRKLISLFQCLD